MKLVWQIVLMICVVVPLMGALFFSEKYQSQGVPHTASASLSTSPMSPRGPSVGVNTDIYQQVTPLFDSLTITPTQPQPPCDTYDSSRCPIGQCAIGMGNICMTIEEADESYVEPTDKPQIPHNHSVETRTKENNQLERVIPEINLILTHPTDWELESKSWSGIPTARTTLKSPRNFLVIIETGIFGIGGGCLPVDESKVNVDTTSLLGKDYFVRLVSTSINTGGGGYIDEQNPDVITADVLESKTQCLNLPFIEVPGLGSDRFFNAKENPQMKNVRGYTRVSMGYQDLATMTANGKTEWLPKNLQAFRDADYRVAIEQILPSIRLVQEE